LPQTDGLAVKQSTYVEGELGVIALRAYRKGELLFKVEGPIRAKPTKYSFAVDLDRHIEPERADGVSDFGHYMNHSCDPNVIVRPVASGSEPPHIDVIARRPIGAGEEIAFDYASLEYDVTVSNAACKCGSRLCRKTIQGFKDLPRDVADRYEREGLIPGHLLDLMRAAAPRRAAAR
jgi:SET domain-containing protein